MGPSFLSALDCGWSQLLQVPPTVILAMKNYNLKLFVEMNDFVPWVVFVKVLWHLRWK